MLHSELRGRLTTERAEDVGLQSSEFTSFEGVGEGDSSRQGMWIERAREIIDCIEENIEQVVGSADDAGASYVANEVMEEKENLKQRRFLFCL
jgi:hypothetical protein